MFLIVSCTVLLRMKNVSDKRSKENQNTHIVFNDFCLKHCALSEIMWKNMVDWGRPQMTKLHMHIPCWIHKATNTHSEYEILNAFPLK